MSPGLAGRWLLPASAGPGGCSPSASVTDSLKVLLDEKKCPGSACPVTQEEFILLLFQDQSGDAGGCSGAISHRSSNLTW